MFNLTPTTDVNYLLPINTIGEQEQKLASSSIKPKEEDGLVKKTSQSSSSPYEQDVVFQNQEGKVWKTGQEVSCLSYEQKITAREAEAILKDANGMSVASILLIFKNSAANIEKAHNKMGYMRGIIQNLAPGRKANHQPEATKQTSLHTRAPLSFGRRTAEVDDENDTSF
jgi:hypothetical protein